MAFISDSTSALLRYWQEGEWRCRFNHLPIAPHHAEDLQFVPHDKIALGKLALESLGEKSRSIWVAPFVFENEQHQKWIPLWLPAQSHKGELSLREHPTFPWIPLSQFESSPDKNLFTGTLHDFNEWCLGEFFTDDQTCSFETWSEFYQASIALLASLSEGQWQQRLESKGYLLSKQGAYFGQSVSEITFSPVLNRYAQVDDAPPNILLEPALLKENAHLFCGKENQFPTLTSHEYDVVIQALALSKGDLLAIETPQGCNKEGVIDAVISSTLVQAAVHEHSLPVIYRLAPATSLLTMETMTKTDDSILVTDLYQNMISGLNLAERLCEARVKELAIDHTIAKLQAEDEAAEQQWNAVLLEQQQAKKARKSLIQRWKSWFGSEPCPFSERIRQIKVRRTKVHQQLVETVEEKAAYRQAEHYWKEWCQSHNITLSPSLDFFAHMREAQQNMATRILKLANAHWLTVQSKLEHKETANDIFPGWKLYKWTIGARVGWQCVSKVDETGGLLIVDEANRLYPQQVLMCLQKVHKAIFMGNSQEFRFDSVVDATTNQQILANYPVLDEELHDDLQFKGMLLSTGNAMTVALANSSIQSYTEYGEWRANCALHEIEPRHPALVKFCNQFHSSKLVSNVPTKTSELAGLHFLGVNGFSHEQGAERVNPMEAKAIYDWLVNAGELINQKSVVIITLYQSQVELLKKVVQSQFDGIEIYTVQSLPSRNWDYVLFSAVLTELSPRPYLFDQNDTFFYSIAARARQGMWVIGDQAVFNLKMHSPSGKLAKYVHANNSNKKTVLITE